MICARVQGHPSRAHLHRGLIEALDPLSVEVSLHESQPPDPWAGYKQALADLPECSHVLVIQDDAQPVPNFAQALYQIADSNPSTPVCLFIGALPSSTAGRARAAMKNQSRRYVPLGVTSFMPLVAVLWPKHKAEEFLHFAAGSRRMTRADDGNAARWMRQAKQEVLVTVPSIVQHNDFTPSVKGGRKHSPGKEKWRQALFLADDALDYVW